jgi:hypothetical protein
MDLAHSLGNSSAAATPICDSVARADSHCLAEALRFTLTSGSDEGAEERESIMAPAKRMLSPRLQSWFCYPEARPIKFHRSTQPSQERAAAALMVKGWSSLDRGHATKAVAGPERFHAMWAANEEQCYAYEGQPCYIGQAYGIVG